MRSESCSFIWHPKVVTWYRFPTALRVARVPYLTVRVPCIPASRWPGTVQKKTYLPGARSAVTEVLLWAIRSDLAISWLPFAIATSWEICEGLSKSIVTSPGLLDSAVLS